jgi:hypothetical protein
VASYGVTNWVRNARVAGEVRITRGRRSETLRIEEVGPEDSIPVLRQYLWEVPVTRPYFDVTLDSTDEEFAAEAPRHPVFRLISPPAELGHDAGTKGRIENGRLEGGASHGLLVRDRARGGAWTGRGRLAGGRDDTAATRWAPVV